MTTTGTSKFPKIFQTGCIGNMKIKNRIIMSPMETGFTSPGGYFSQRDIDYYTARARGGVGMIITQGVFIENEVEPFLNIPAPLMDHPTHVFKANDLVEAVHDGGTRIAVQLVVGAGRYAESLYPGKPPVSSSPLHMFMYPDVICKELSIEEIKQLVKAFAVAAQRSVMAGFDMIEIHAHTGYLMDQFMCALWNKRSDEYGGGLENRMRFPLEIIKAIRDTVGPDFPLCFRMSGEHKIEGGRTIEESCTIARMLEGAGINAIHVDGGCYESMPWIFPPAYWPRGNMADDAAAIRKAVGIPVLAVGGINTPEMAEDILEQGKADFVVMGRQMLADPAWTDKVKDNRTDEIAPCIRCNEGCIGRYFKANPISCSVNPAVGKERDYAIAKTGKPKKVLVVGGGPAGMEAAMVAAIRGHDVALYEKGLQLGGQLRAACRPSFKADLGKLVDYLAKAVKRLGVEVVTGKELNRSDIENMKPDAVVVATGAKPLLPPIPGVDNARVVTAYDFEMRAQPAGKSVLVVGGGLVGCELALSLAQQSKNVTVVEMLPEVASDLNMVSRVLLLQMLAGAGVSILTNTCITGFGDVCITASDKDNNEIKLNADTIILACGSCADNVLAEELAGFVDELYVIGDSASPRKIGEAIREGYVCGLTI